MHTLPTGVSNNGNTLLYELAKRKQGRLDGPFHGADNDQAYIKVFGYPRDKIGFQLGALFSAEFRQFGVMEGVVLWKMLVKNRNEKRSRIQSQRGHLLSTLCRACACRTRMMVGGMINKSRWRISLQPNGK